MSIIKVNLDETAKRVLQDETRSFAYRIGYLQGLCEGDLRDCIKELWKQHLKEQAGRFSLTSKEE